MTNIEEYLRRMWTERIPNFMAQRGITQSSLGWKIAAALVFVFLGARRRFMNRLQRFITIRQAEEKLRDIQNEMQALVDNSSAIITMRDLNGKITLVNREFERIFGVNRDQMVGKTDRSLWPDMHAQKMSDEDRRVLRTGESIRDYLELTREGRHEYYYYVKFPIRDDNGKLKGVCSIATDITEQKALEKERANLEVRERTAIESSRIKSEFLANMSHEIRTPINGIVGMTGLLLDTELSAEQREYAENIRRCSDSLLSVINDILDFSKIESGKLSIDSVDFDLSQLLSDIDRTFHFSAQEKGLRFGIRGDVIKHPVFKSDPGRIRQILTNLVSNAIKFTQSGSVFIELKILSDHANATEFRFEVRDTGIGLSEDAKSRLFQSFTQADASVTRRFGGTGLGLSISKRLVELMGGSIGVDSEEGKGACFWFNLRLIKGDHKFVSIEDVIRLEAISLKDHKGKRILVAEDNPMNQKVAIKQLEKLGYHVDAVGNGLEVISVLESVPYDIVLMDCQMPELDGYEATRRIRSQAGTKFQNIPIVAMTANAIQGERERCLAAGMNDYVSKPFNIKDLAQVLENWLSLSEHRNVQSIPRAGSTRPNGNVLDPGIIQGLRDLDDGQNAFLKEYGEMFFERTPNYIEDVKLAIREKKYSVVKSLAHQMKSSAGNLGASYFSKLCLELELWEDWSNVAGLQARILSLENELRNVNEAYKAEILKDAA